MAEVINNGGRNKIFPTVNRAQRSPILFLRSVSYALPPKTPNTVQPQSSLGFNSVQTWIFLFLEESIGLHMKCLSY